MAPGPARARAVTRPGGRLAPPRLVTNGPAVSRAAASSLVVVVLPLVPLTRPAGWPLPSEARAPGSRARLTRPPITEPSPAPTDRDSAATPAPARLASRVRRPLNPRRDARAGWPARFPAE